MSVDRRLRACLLGVLLACAAQWPAAASAAALSNTAVTTAQVSPYFNIFCCSLVAILDGNISGVHMFTAVRAGTIGTAAEGLFLYSYFIEDQGDGAAVRQFSVPFAPLVAFDFTGAGASTSAFCSNCTGGTVDPASSDSSGGIVSYDFPNGIGRFASDPFLVSNVGPASVSGSLLLSPGGSFAIDVLAPAAPVPEPSSLVLVLAGGLAGLRALIRLRHRRS